MHPSILKIFIGGYSGPSFGLRWENAALFYDRFNSGYEHVETVELHPTEADWKKFWAQLEKLGVWAWDKEYVQAGIMDGTNWSLELNLRDANLTSGGSNAYPKHFKRFCKAVSNLAGRREFV